MFIYACLVVNGAVRMQNLESRRWGMAGSIMALFPFCVGGVMGLVAMLVNLVVGIIAEEPASVPLIAIIAMSLVYVISIAGGVYALMTLFNEDVIDGFEYVGEDV
jgi:hypothetical protein